jgi:LmbE family N-acetylglucosaminyl deacetylase
MSSEPNVVFVFPHQDDEMGIYHRMRRLLRQGRHLFMIWVTDGAANVPEIRQDWSIRLLNPFLARESDETIRRVRKAESTALMRHLGVLDAQLDFLAFPSGLIKGCFPQMVTALAELFRELRPAQVYSVPYDHFEFEHDACNGAVRFASRGLDDVGLFEFPLGVIYKGVFHQRWFIPYEGVTIERTLFTRQDELERLWLFRRLYPSQRYSAWIDRAANFFPWEYKRLGEPHRRMPDYDYSRPIPVARVNYIPRSMCFEDFRSMVWPYLET